MALDLDVLPAGPLAVLQTYIEQEQLTIPVLPAVAIDMLRMYKEPDANARGMAELIQKDQSLVSSVLRVCNSAAYGGVRPITSLQLAIARLGVRVLGRIAVSHIVRGKVFSGYNHEDEMAEIWSHAQLTALLGTELARLARRDEEEAYLCGLLHSVGKPTAFQAIEDLKAKRKIDVTSDEASALAEAFHCQVGHRVAMAWSLPATVQATCLHYLAPDEAPDEAVGVVSLVHLASRLARAFRDRDDEAAREVGAASEVALLGIAPRDLEALVQRADELVEKSEKISD